MKQYIRWKEVLPIYRGIDSKAILISLEEHNFIEEDRVEVNGGYENERK